MAAHNRLLGFVDRTAIDAPPPSPSPQQDRASRQAIANKLRVSRKQHSGSANIDRAQNSEHAHDGPAEFSQSKTVQGGHSKDFELEQEQERQRQNRDKFETSTVGEDFDNTVSQENFWSGPNVADIGVNDEYDNDYHQGQQDEAEQRNNYYQGAQYQNGDDRDMHDEPDLGKGCFEDESIAHQSHKTLPQYNGQGPHTQALGQSLYKQSQTLKLGIQTQPLQPKAPQANHAKNNKISGRFNQSAQVNTLANRPKNVMQTGDAPRKRAFDDGVFAPVPKDEKSSQVVETLEDSIPRGITPYPLPPPRTQNISPAQINGTSDEGYTDVESHITEQPALQSRPIDRQAADLQHQNGSLNLASIELDYDDAVLKKMNYNQLKDESFEATPAAPEQSSEPDMSISDRTLPERVSYHVEQIRTSNAQDIDKLRTAMAEFFGSLSKDEWEEAGDWFLDRFGETLRAIKNARKEKRDVVAEFEREIERREKDVRGSLQAYNEDMERMKRGARGVIEGKI